VWRRRASPGDGCSGPRRPFHPSRSSRSRGRRSKPGSDSARRKVAAQEGGVLGERHDRDIDGGLLLAPAVRLGRPLQAEVGAEGRDADAEVLRQGWKGHILRQRQPDRQNQPLRLALSVVLRDKRETSGVAGPADDEFARLELCEARGAQWRCCLHAAVRFGALKGSTRRPARTVAPGAN
jgi:hypothetical protein